MKINWLWSFFSSFDHSLRFFGKLASFANPSVKQLPQLSFGLARCLQVWRKVALVVCFRFEFGEHMLSEIIGFQSK
ncbi:hypothetical protein CJ419_22655 [Vibrio navarrensis]|nr:hypothetical protein [Vibrio navarrensis]